MASSFCVTLSSNHRENKGENRESVQMRIEMLELWDDVLEFQALESSWQVFLYQFLIIEHVLM